MRVWFDCQPYSAARLFQTLGTAQRGGTYAREYLINATIFRRAGEGRAKQGLQHPGIFVVGEDEHTDARLAYGQLGGLVGHGRHGKAGVLQRGLYACKRGRRGCLGVPDDADSPHVGKVRHIHRTQLGNHAALARRRSSESECRAISGASPRLQKSCADRFLPPAVARWR